MSYRIFLISKDDAFLFKKQVTKKAPPDLIKLPRDFSPVITFGSLKKVKRLLFMNLALDSLQGCQLRKNIENINFHVTRI